VAAGSCSRILLIEDHGPSRHGLAQYLNGFGYDVLEAADGLNGLAAAMTFLPDAIVLDLGLPDLDGWSVARELRSAAVTVPIIALTGADLPHERASALRAGCDLHLSKPCPPGTLLDALRRLTIAESAGPSH
jgi:DNA-binding response OmpR family regulator